MISSHSCCRFLCWPTMMRLIPRHLKGAPLDWNLVTVEAIWAQWIHCHVLTCRHAKFWLHDPNVAVKIKTHQTRQHFFNLQLSNFEKLVWIMVSGFLFLAGRRFPYSGLATSLHFNEWLVFLSISWNQCGHSPLSSTRYFDSKNCCSLDIFSFWDPSLWF